MYAPIFRRAFRSRVLRRFLGLWLSAIAVNVLAEELQCPPLVESQIDVQVAPAQARGLLWRIDDAQHRERAPSFLFGTIHVGDPRVVHVPTEVKSALLASRMFIMEAKFDPNGVAEFAKQMELPPEKDLRTIVGPALFDRAGQLLAHFAVPMEQTRHLRPWAAFMTLNQPQGESGMPLDLVLMKMASAAGKPVAGIETLREQAAVFAGFSDAEQVAMLRDSVCYYDRLQSDLRRLVAMYLQRDLGGIVHLASAYDGSDPALAARMLKVLISDRNARMAERLQPVLRAGGAFIAVGALHLPGEQGLLHLIEARGLTVSRVY